MTQAPQSKAAVRRPSRDVVQVAFAASMVSLLSFFYYFQRGEILLYGDAVAHINIARRVFDSQTPGLLQFGTVWLPLPHLLMVPFLVSKEMWQSGAGGSIPSMIAYVFSVIGIFRLVRCVLEVDARTQPSARAAAWVAALVYGLNPNLIYLQVTAMTESLYLALFVWALVYFAEFLQGLGRGVENWRSKLFRCGLCIAGAELTRYDGWFLAAVIALAVVGLTARRWDDSAFRWVAPMFLAGIAAVPVLWLGYNAAAYGNPLEFANGPYSARAIEQRTSAPGSPPHPGTSHVVTAASYILKSGELNMADGGWGRIWVAIAAAGLVLIFVRRRRLSVLLLLWIPLVFYALSIAYGGVPLFLPAWWPYTWYNLRYGLQLLPLFAVSAGLIVSAGPEVVRPMRSARKETRDERQRPEANLSWLAVCGVLIAIVALSYASVWRAQPLCFKEAWVNSRTKLALESAVARSVSRFPRDSTYLMYLGDHVGAFQQAGIPLRQVVNEGNHRPWKKPADPEGLWEQALADPANHVDFVISYDGDDVDRLANKSSLTLLSEIHTTGQAHARIYATRRTLNQSR